MGKGDWSAEGRSEWCVEIGHGASTKELAWHVFPCDQRRKGDIGGLYSTSSLVLFPAGRLVYRVIGLLCALSSLKV
jgi:hypothetical protein